MKLNFIKTFFILLFASFSINMSAQSSHVLWYNQPAEFFEESLVLGNGKMGATVFGGKFGCVKIIVVIPPFLPQ
ncbi:glycoside hydrolase N-terminal domain-containing protein [Flavobacterium sp. LBUM151]